MSQPTYNDMGKTCRDFFSKGYNLGIFKVNLKNKASNGFETVANLTYNRETKTSKGDFEAKNVCPSWGLTSNAKWNTSNLYTGRWDLQDKIAKGLKLSLEGQYDLDSGARLAKFGTQYKVDTATVDLGLEGGDEANLCLNGSVVLGYKNFLAGCQLVYDSNEQSMKTSNVAMGYVASNGLTVHTNLDNADTLYGGVHYKIKPNLEGAIQGSYASSDDSPTKFGVGFKYINSICTAIKLKFDSTNKIGFGYEIKLTPGAVITFSTLIEGNNFFGKGGEGHKVGVALDFGQ